VKFRQNVKNKNKKEYYVNIFGFFFGAKSRQNVRNKNKRQYFVKNISFLVKESPNFKGKHFGGNFVLPHFSLVAF
jgi:hypothetical protein